MFLKLFLQARSLVAANQSRKRSLHRFDFRLLKKNVHGLTKKCHFDNAVDDRLFPITTVTIVVNPKIVFLPGCLEGKIRVTTEDNADCLSRQLGEERERTRNTVTGNTTCT